MSQANGKADDGALLYAPITALYQERVLREQAEARAASAIQRAELAERQLAEWLALAADKEPDSALGRRAALELALREAGLRKLSSL